MQPGHNGTHWRTLSLALALVEAALELELRDAFLLLDDGRDFEEAVGFADIGVSGSIATTNGDRFVGLLENFEVVGDHGADLVGVGEEVFAIPEVGGGLGALIFIGEVCALSHVS